jgi:hypothetical protein
MKEAKMVDITTGVKRIELQQWSSFQPSIGGPLSLPMKTLLSKGQLQAFCKKPGKNGL